ncbi:MAG: protoporphyrinogen oxidase, partial [Halobacteria archaeon]|nr:protoporphyrinogen oxidase [Halobacteria archaeon]
AGEFKEITECDARVLNVHKLERGIPAHDRSWEALDGLEFPEGIHLCTNYTSRAGIPGRIREAKETADVLSD